MFERIGISSGNLKTDKILLNEKGHLKVVNILSYPEDTLGTGFDADSPGVPRFYGIICK